MRRQSGFGLMVMLVVVVLAGTYVVINQLSAAGGQTAARRDHNARVLQQAKQALIGYVALRAGQTGEQDPGSLPCPEAPGNYNDPTYEGTAAGNCSVPAVGRFPWRTLGVDKLTDASGEPLWYVVSPGWHKPSSTDFTVVTLYSSGQLTVDGAANSAVALIIAPGAPLASTAVGCAGISQTRNAASANVVNYLDCENATPADGIFATSGPSGSFNDQVLRVGAREVLNAIEKPIVMRIEREIVPAIRSVYASTAWGSNVSASNPVYPFPTGSGSTTLPDPGAAASYRGTSSSCSSDACQGLLPAVFTGTPSGSICTPSASSPCDPNFVQWVSGSATVHVTEVTVDGILYVEPFSSTFGSGILWDSSPNSCSVITVNSATPQQHTALQCNVRVPGLLNSATTNVLFRIRGNATNVGMAFREFDTSKISSPYALTITSGPSATLSTGGTATATFWARMDVPASHSTFLSLSDCGLVGSLADLRCRQVQITVPITFFGDAPVVNQRHPTLGWFSRNEWYRLLFYATARDVTPANSSTSACDRSDGECLEFNGQGDKRALLAYAGRSLTGASGWTRTFADFLEDHPQNIDGGRVFESGPVGPTRNDRFMVVQVQP
jgi:hypothetical protein